MADVSSRNWFNVVFGRCNILIIARWPKCSDFLLRALVSRSMPRLPCDVTYFRCFQLDRLLSSGCLGVIDSVGAVAWIFVISMVVLYLGQPRYEVGCSPPQIAHLVSLHWNLASGSLPTLARPHWNSHWDCQWEKKPHWESQWESQWGLAQDFDFWWGFWWGSWFSMRFLPKTSLRSWFWKVETISLRFSMRKTKYFP